jgi:hypothetical protein
MGFGCRNMRWDSDSSPMGFRFLMDMMLLFDVAITKWKYEMGFG